MREPHTQPHAQQATQRNDQPRQPGNLIAGHEDPQGKHGKTASDRQFQGITA